MHTESAFSTSASIGGGAGDKSQKTHVHKDELNKNLHKKTHVNGKRVF